MDLYLEVDDVWLDNEWEEGWEEERKRVRYHQKYLGDHQERKFQSDIFISSGGV